MTGLDPSRDRVCEVAVVRWSGGRVVDEFSSLVCPPVPMSEEATRVCGLTDDDLRGAPVFAKVAERLAAMLDGSVVVGHKVPFDLGFVQREMTACFRVFPPPVHLDTLLMSRRLFAFPRNSLTEACRRLGVAAEPNHRALGDARANLELYRRMIEILDPGGALGVTVGELKDLLGALAPNSPLRLAQRMALESAFRERRTVVLDYQSTSDPRAGVVRREVGVWLLNLPYIQGWCFLRGGERVFRLDRVRSLERAERIYEIPDFDRKI
jgi:DNA polymerase III epsilon subunit family exonuclease